jgi:hypothetical protein
MINYQSIAEYAIGEVDFSNATPDPFRELLKSNDIELTYLIELQPYNDDQENIIEGVPPISVGAIGEFGFNVKGGLERLYISDTGYITEPIDSPSNRAYLPLTTNPYQFESSILSGGDFSGASPSFGAIRLLNGDKYFDNALSYFWKGRNVTVYVGGRDFKRSDFAIAFQGLVSETEYDDDEIIINIQNNSQTLETEFVQNLYEGAGGLDGGDDIKGSSKPLAYGEVKNITPVLVDATNLIYQVHDGATKSVDGVFDKGIALTNGGNVADITSATVGAGQYKTQLSGGYIKLGSSPDGSITADIKGDDFGGEYVDKVGAIVSRLVRTKLGASNFSDNQIDQGALNQLDESVTGACGFYIQSNTTLKSVIDALVNPLQCYWTFTRDGLLTAGVLDAPSSSSITLTESDILDNEFELITDIPPSWRIGLSYGRAWTVQNKDNLASAAPIDRQTFVSEQYRTVIDENRAIRTLAVKEKRFDTLLANQSDALNELERIKRIFRELRQVYRIKAVDLFFKVFIGDVVNLKISRFDLSNGKNFIVTTIEEDAETGHTTLELFG